ncbi:MAG: glycosyltransferase [Proteobacteria bacterium]|nr:MAG: glycosyltransferase [Pseudomonadota bacterium]
MVLIQVKTSVALCTYNGEKFLSQQLESIFGQSHAVDEIIVCDDGSTDVTLSILQAFQRDYPQVLKIHQNKQNLGGRNNFEKCFNLCSGDVIFFCDQDDIWYPQKLSKLVARIQATPPMSVVHCDMHILKGGGDHFERIEGTAWSLELRGIRNVKPSDLLIRSVISGAGMIIDADLVHAFPVIPYPAFEHDHWYPFVASTKGGVHPLSEPLYDYRIHSSNVSGLSEYRGFFHRTKRLPEMTVIQKCMVAFNGSAARCREAILNDLPVSSIDQIMTRSFFDLGTLYLLKAARNFWCDRPIARACVSRAGGKIFRLIYRSFGEHRYR